VVPGTAGLLAGALAMLEPASEPSAPADAPAAAEATSSAEFVATLIVRSDGVAADALAAALRVRVPEATLLDYGDEAFAAVDGKSFAYVEVLGSETVALTIVLSDGRGYVRRFAPDAADRTRSIAAMIANTLVAIAEEQVEPDRRDAEIPPVQRPEHQQRQPAPKPAQTAPVAPAIAVEPKPVPPRAPPRSAELGLSLPAGAVFGLAPRTVAGVAGGGGALRVELRAPAGAVLALGLRAIGRANDGDGLARVRIQLGGGYDYRRGRFELLVVGGATIEPWVVARIEPTGLGAARQSPLLGVAASVAPGVRLRVGERTALRIAGFVELAGSALSSGSVARIVRQRDDGSRIGVFTLGGLELAVGVELGLWFRLRAPRRDRLR
jgi:hypothetical protein